LVQEFVEGEDILSDILCSPCPITIERVKSYFSKIVEIMLYVTENGIATTSITLNDFKVRNQ